MQTEISRVVAIHQPNYLPWIGLFSKIAISHCFVIADTMPFTKQSVTARNKIRTNSGWHYLTIPVSKDSELTRICDVLLPQDNSWQQAHWKLINDSYGRTEFFASYQEFFQELYQSKLQYLWEINEKIIAYLLKCFNIDVEVLKASEMALDPSLQRTDLIIAMLKGARSNIYLSGPSGRSYLQTEKFSQDHLDIRYIKFQHPVYKQRFQGFEPNMSAIDLLFNVGPRAGEMLRACATIES